MIEEDCKVSPVLGERPENIPENWIIFNAPRPMFGHETWEGEFRHGIFYGAINPDDIVTQPWFYMNKGLDGWVVKYVTIQEIISTMRAYYERRYGKEHDVEEILSKASEQEIIQGFFHYAENMKSVREFNEFITMGTGKGGNK